MRWNDSGTPWDGAGAPSDEPRVSFHEPRPSVSDSGVFPDKPERSYLTNFSKPPG